jgi:hypothetical protein
MANLFGFPIIESEKLPKGEIKLGNLEDYNKSIMIWICDSCYRRLPMDHWVYTIPNWFGRKCAYCNNVAEHALDPDSLSQLDKDILNG